MTVRFMTNGLRLRGVDVLTAQEDDAERLPDPALLDRATALGRVLVSQDEDLLYEATRRQSVGEEFAESSLPSKVESVSVRCKISR